METVDIFCISKHFYEVASAGQEVLLNISFLIQQSKRINQCSAWLIVSLPVFRREV